MRQVVSACLATRAAIGGLLELGTLVRSWSGKPCADPHRHSDVRQVVEACLATRAVNGGLLELGSLRRYVSASAPPRCPVTRGSPVPARHSHHHMLVVKRGECAALQRQEVTGVRIFRTQASLRADCTKKCKSF